MALKVYLDASVLVPLFTNDALSGRADAYLRTARQGLVITDLCAAEVASAVARKVRMGLLSRHEAQDAFSDFDAWVPKAVQRVEIGPADVRAAEAFIRQLELPLRPPDAIHIAAAQRIGATLATFDERMGQSAAALDLPVAEL